MSSETPNTSHSRSSKLTRAFMIVPLFFFLNIALSLMNRYALGHLGFKFPLILTAFHALFSFLSMMPIAVRTHESRMKYYQVIKSEWKGVSYVGFWLSVNIALNNLSLVYIDLGLNQIIRSSIPLVTAAVSSVTQRKLPQKHQLLGLILLCLGVATAIGEASASGDSFGVFLCILSVLAGSAQLITTSKVLQGQIDAIQLMFLSAPVTFFCLLTPYYIMEHNLFLDYLSLNVQSAAFVVLLTSGLAGFYNVVHNDLVAITDPITTCVLGQLKIIALLILGAVLLGEGRNFTPKMSIGCTAAIVGFSIYSWAKVRPSQRSVIGEKIQKVGSPSTPKNLIKRIALPRLVVDYSSDPKETPEPTLPGLYTPGKSTGSTRTSHSSARQRTSSSKKTPGRLV